MVRLNNKGFDFAKKLIKQGDINYEDNWEFTTEDENAILYHAGEEPDWDFYSKFFLAIDTKANEETKARYKFPVAKLVNGKPVIFRRGVIAGKVRASQYDYPNIAKACDILLELIDEKQNEEKTTNKVVFKTLELNEVITTNEDKKRVIGIASTRDYDREGDRILSWKFDNYLKNPVVLWSHKTDEPPIARVIELWEENGKLYFEAEFADTERANEIYELIKNGFINAFSVGFIPLRGRRNELGGYDYDEVEIVEISVVNVPANPQAVVVSKEFKLEILAKIEEIISIWR